MYVNINQLKKNLRTGKRQLFICKYFYDYFFQLSLSNLWKLWYGAFLNQVSHEWDKVADGVPQSKT